MFGPHAKYVLRFVLKPGLLSVAFGGDATLSCLGSDFGWQGALAISGGGCSANNGLQPNSNGLQPSSDGLRPSLVEMASKLVAMASNLVAMASNLVAVVASNCFQLPNSVATTDMKH